jgi:hypothetical protein
LIKVEALEQTTIQKIPIMRKVFIVLLFSIVCFSFHQLPAVKSNRNLPSMSVQLIADYEETKGLLTHVNFEDSLKQLYNTIDLQAYGLDYSVFRLGMVGYYSLDLSGSLNEKRIISIIDFSKPSTKKRFYTIDLANGKVLYHTYVAHGKNTGENMATKFSNRQHSNQSSLGFYVTGETYIGSKGYSLRLDGKDPSYNDNIRSRAVVMHDADYVSESWIKRYGRLGRSQGCPALPKEISRKVIDTIKGRTTIFAYYPDESYLSASPNLKLDNLMESLEERSTQLAGAPMKFSQGS